MISHPGLPQIRTCGHYRIRFLNSWVRCADIDRTISTHGKQRVPLEETLEHLSCAVVIDKRSRPLHILTKIDLVDFLLGRAGNLT